MIDVEITKQYAKELMSIKEIRVEVSRVMLAFGHSAKTYDFNFPNLKDPHSKMLYGFTADKMNWFDLVAPIDIREEDYNDADLNSINWAEKPEFLFEALLNWIKEN